MAYTKYTVRALKSVHARGGFLTFCQEQIEEALLYLLSSIGPDKVAFGDYFFKVVERAKPETFKGTGITFVKYVTTQDFQLRLVLSTEADSAWTGLLHIPNQAVRMGMADTLAVAATKTLGMTWLPKPEVIRPVVITDVPVAKVQKVAPTIVKTRSCPEKKKQAEPVVELVGAVMLPTLAAIRDGARRVSEIDRALAALEHQASLLRRPLPNLRSFLRKY